MSWEVYIQCALWMTEGLPLRYPPPQNKVSDRRIMAATNFITPVILLCLAIFLRYKISPLSNELPVASCNLQWGLVTWRDQGVCCDECGIWYHVACQSIGCSTLGALNSSGVSWVCCSCNCPNYSAVYSYRSTDLSNAFEALSTSGSTSEQRSIASPIPLATSSPNYKCTSQMPNKSSCRPIRLLNLNARSLIKKKVDFCNLVEST